MLVGTAHDLVCGAAANWSRRNFLAGTQRPFISGALSDAESSPLVPLDPRFGLTCASHLLRYTVVGVCASMYLYHSVRAIAAKSQLHQRGDSLLHRIAQSLRLALAERSRYCRANTNACRVPTMGYIPDTESAAPGIG